MKKQQKQPTAVGKALRILGGAGGGAVGGYWGAPTTGTIAGKALGAAVSKWLGFGDYKVSKNSIVSSSGSIPMMHKSSGSVVIRHREFVREVTGSTDFTNRFALILQPGNADAFPWLAQIARGFQQYKWRGVVFHYIPTSGHAVSSTNPAIGEVILQTSYRATDTAPGSKAEMLNEYWASEAAPDKSFIHPIECDPKENPFAIHYIRTGDPPEGDTRMMYDLGVTYVATNGMPANDNTVGDLWVTYEVELLKPVVKTNTNSYAPAVLASPTPSGISITDMLGLSGTLTTSDGWRPFSVLGNNVTFNWGSTTGRFLFMYHIRCGTNFSAMSMPSSVTVANLSVVPGADGQTYRRTQIAGTAPSLTSGFLVFEFEIIKPFKNCTITLPTFAFTGVPDSGLVSITQVSDL